MKRVATFALGVALLATACQSTQQEEKVIGKQAVEVKDGLLTPETLWAMGRLGEVALSPDKQHIAYSVRYFSIAENKGNTDLYMCNTDGSNVRQLTRTAASEGNICWLNDHTLAYLSAAADGTAQMFGIDIRKSGFPKPVQITNIKGGMDGFKLSPDLQKIAFIRDVRVEPLVRDLYPDLPLSSGKINTDLNYRHWDHWVEAVPHTFVAELSGCDLRSSLGAVKHSRPVDVLKGEPFEAPLKPFGGTEQFDFSPNGKYIAFTTKKLTGKRYAESTNSDVWVYDLETGESINASENNLGFDMNPLFSPDGRYLIWESMERDGYESDRTRIILRDMESGERIEATYGWEQFAGNLAWSEDSRYIYFTSDYHATDQIYRLDVEQTVKEALERNERCGHAGFLKGDVISAVSCLTSGVHDYHSVIPVSDERILGVRMSMIRPDEIYSIDLTQSAVAAETGTYPQSVVSHINDEIFAQIEDAVIEDRWMKSTTGEDMQVWVVYPPHFDPKKKYPTLLYCEGGPQSTISQFWSYRWNMSIMAANGYIVVAPNRHGLPGFGMSWNEQISGDYGGQNMKDYLTAIDEMCKEPFVDVEKLGCVGASYGGFSVYWLAGHHENRFKAFIAHDGMFNFDQQYLETEEMWFVNWDLGGPYWEKNNAVAQRSYANSPHRFVDKWTAPIMVVHGELDYRIVASQGMAAHNAAILNGVESEYLYFPDENHWVLQPQNGILWQRRFFHFLDKHVKGLTPEQMASTHHAERPFIVRDPFDDEASSVERGGAKELNTEKQVAQ